MVDFHKHLNKKHDYIFPTNTKYSSVTIYKPNENNLNINNMIMLRYSTRTKRDKNDKICTIIKSNNSIEFTKKDDDDDNNNSSKL